MALIQNTISCFKRHQVGVTLFELIVAMLIIAILAAIAIPSYRYITASDQMAGELDRLTGSLEYARSEAVREGEPVTVCVEGISDSSCAETSTAWQNGWIVFTDMNSDQTVDSGDTVLEVVKPFTSSDTLISNNGVSAVTFDKQGFAYLGSNDVEFVLSNGNPAYTRCLYLSQSGMIQTAAHAMDPTCQ